MLQKAYAKIGGIHGNGFSSPDDMVRFVPFWKIDRRGERILSVVLYKDKGGRKSVACATDGTAEGKASLARIVKDEVTQNRSYGERSGPLLSFAKAQLPEGALEANALAYKDAEKILGEPIRRPPADDPEILKHPELKDKFYQRMIGGEWHTKVMMGTVGLSIVKR